MSRSSSASPAMPPSSRSTARASSSRCRNRLSSVSTSADRSPCSTIRPWSNTRISSTMSSVDSRWAMMNVVRPTISWLTAAEICCSVAGSTRAVASSRTTRSGLRSHTLARASSWACPADRPAPPAPSGRSHRRRSTSTSRPTARSASSTAASVGAGSYSVTLSRTVPSNSSTSWGTERDATSQLGHRDVGDRHAAELEPALGRLDEAEQEARERRLAAAGAADDADRAATGDRETSMSCRIDCCAPPSVS